MAEGPKLTARLDIDPREFNKGLKDAEGEVQGFGKKLGGVASILKAGLFSAAAITALKVLKDVFVSTEGGADKFKATIDGGKEALGHFKRSLAELDFSNLISGLDEAFRKGKAFAELFDQLGEATAFGNIELAKLQEESNKAWQQAQQNKGEERKKWLAEFIAVEKQYNAQAKNLAKQTYEINKAKWESINKVDADYAASVFQTHQDMFFNDMSTLNKYKAFIDGLAAGVRPMDVGAGAGEVAVGKGYSVQIAEALFDYYNTFSSFADGGPQDLAKIILDLANGINSADAKLNGALRKTRDLVEDPVLAERITGIKGDFTPAGPSAQTDATTLSNMQFAAEQLSTITNDQISMAMELGAVFSDVFMSATRGWRAMADAIIDNIKRIAAEILANAAAWAILNIITKGQAGSFSNYMSGSGGISGAIGQGLNSIGSANATPIQVQGVISGRDIAIINARGGSQLNGGT